MKGKISFFITLTIILLLFMFGYSMTPTPGSFSGNGNPAILLLIPLSILFIVLIVQWFKIFRHTRLNIKLIILMTLAVICHHIVGLYYQITSFHNYRNLLAEVYAEQFGDIDWQYIDSITSGFSIHINNQYFNVNTYFLYVSLSFLIWLLSQLSLSLRNKLNQGS